VISLRDGRTSLRAVGSAEPANSRIACLDNDGTLWCERLTYVQFDFFVDALRLAVRDDSKLADRREYAALLSGDRSAIGEIGLE
jgi:hypothetical protein